LSLIDTLEQAVIEYAQHPTSPKTVLGVDFGAGQIDIGLAEVTDAANRKLIDLSAAGFGARDINFLLFALISIN
jgi:hypothetical protein